MTRHYNGSELNHRAERSIAHGALTNSKRPATHVRGVYPTHIRHGHGCIANDVDGNRYIDLICGLGTNLFGYGNPKITDAVTKAMQSGGSVFSLGSDLEVEVAEQLKGTFPFLERVRFLKSGSEGCTAAVRIARAFHGVRYDNQNMQEMWFTEGLDRISQEEKFQGWPSERMQAMYPSLSEPTTAERKQKEIAAEILADSEGDSHRKESQTEKAGAHQEAWAGKNLLPSKASAALRGTHQEFVRGMWKRELSSASSRLPETSGRGMAMQPVPRQGTRGLILSEGYHGHSDEFVSLNTPANGVPQGASILPLYGNEELLAVAAAVIVEPVITDYSNARQVFLQELRETCNKTGALLIFDETITAYRFPGFCVARHWNIVPDLWIGGKAIAGGLPLSVVGGRADVMESDYFVSSTWAGDRLALAAAGAACNMVHGAFKPEDLWLYGQEFMEKFNAVSPAIQAIGYPTRGVWKFSTDLHKTLWFQEMCKAGVLVGPSWFYNKFIHNEQKNIISIHKGISRKIQEGKCRVEGHPPESPFAERIRNDEKT